MFRSRGDAEGASRRPRTVEEPATSPSHHGRPAAPGPSRSPCATTPPTARHARVCFAEVPRPGRARMGLPARPARRRACDCLRPPGRRGGLALRPGPDGPGIPLAGRGGGGAVRQLATGALPAGAARVRSRREGGTTSGGERTEPPAPQNVKPPRAGVTRPLRTGGAGGHPVEVRTRGPLAPAVPSPQRRARRRGATAARVGGPASGGTGVRPAPAHASGRDRRPVALGASPSCLRRPSPSTSTFGSARSSQRGSHQAFVRRAARAPPARSPCGRRTRRRSTAMARPKPIILIICSLEPMKPEKTAIMMTAAAVTTRAPCLKPVTIACAGPLAVDVRLPHPGDQEDLVVHRETEDHAHHEDRHHRHDRAGLLRRRTASRASPTGRPRRPRRGRRPPRAGSRGPP